MESRADRVGLENSLRWSLQALAAAGPEALRRIPEWVVRSDELALDFDAVFPAYVGNFGADLTVAQRHALFRVDTLLQEMSAAGSELWNDEAVCSHPAWDEVRLAAGAALRELNWDGE